MHTYRKYVCMIYFYIHMNEYEFMVAYERQYNNHTLPYCNLMQYRKIKIIYICIKLFVINFVAFLSLITKTEV